MEKWQDKYVIQEHKSGGSSTRNIPGPVFSKSLRQREEKWDEYATEFMTRIR